MPCGSPPIGVPLVGCCGEDLNGTNLIEVFHAYYYCYVSCPAAGQRLRYFSTCTQTFEWIAGPNTGLSKVVQTTFNFDGSETQQVLSESAGFAQAFADETDTTHGDWQATVQYFYVSSGATILSETSFSIVNVKGFSLTPTDPNVPKFKTTSRLSGELDFTSIIGNPALPNSLFHICDVTPFSAIKKGQFLVNFYRVKPDGTLGPFFAATFEDTQLHFLFEVGFTHSGHRYGSAQENSFGVSKFISEGWGSRNAPGWPVCGQQRLEVNRTSINYANRPATIVTAAAWKAKNWNETLECEEERRATVQTFFPTEGEVIACRPFGGTASQNRGGVVLCRPLRPLAANPQDGATASPCSDLALQTDPNDLVQRREDGTITRIRNLYYKEAALRKYSDANPACCTFPNPAP